MKLIDISTPKHPNTFAMVDDEDYDFLSQWKWLAVQQKDAVYARRTTRAVEGKGKGSVRMHRAILNPRNYQQVDHIDRNGLNNTRANLRICTGSQNCRNKSKMRKSGTSRFKGVSYRPTDKRFHVRIMLDTKEAYLGSFDNEIDAAKAYNNAALEHFGEFARLNQIATPL